MSEYFLQKASFSHMTGNLVYLVFTTYSLNDLILCSLPKACESRYLFFFFPFQKHVRGKAPSWCVYSQEIT